MSIVMLDWFGPLMCGWYTLGGSDVILDLCPSFSIHKL